MDRSTGLRLTRREPAVPHVELRAPPEPITTPCAVDMPIAWGGFLHRGGGDDGGDGDEDGDTEQDLPSQQILSKRYGVVNCSSVPDRSLGLSHVSWLTLVTL